MLIEAPEMSGDQIEAVKAGSAASTQAQSFLQQARYLLTALCYNSLIANMASLLDLIANPSAVLAATAGQPYLVVNYNGRDGGNAEPRDIAAMGAYAMPSASGDSRIWWEAVAEMVIRLGNCPVEEGTIAQGSAENPQPSQLVELLGFAGAAAYPQRYITDRTFIRVPALVGENVVPIVQGASAYAARLVAAQRGETITAAAVTVTESGNKARAVAVADIFEKEAKKRALIAYGAMGAVPAAMFVGRMVKGRKGRRR